jgi:hypothetical protein
MIRPNNQGKSVGKIGRKINSVKFGPFVSKSTGTAGAIGFALQPESAASA